MALPVSSSIVVMEWLTKAVTPDALGTLSAEVSASATTMSLSGGYASLPSGAQPVLIGSELAIVRQSGGTLTVEPNGRGYFGTTAAVHVSSATVSIANLSSMIGTDAYETSPPKGWPNETPSIAYAIVGGTPDPLSSGGTTYMHQPFLQFQIRGGKDSQGNWPDLAPDFVHRALVERFELTLGACGEDVTSGRIVSAGYDGQSQLIFDEDIKPPQPKILCFGKAQII